MGYASPLGYTGYAPTDDKLQEDTTLYQETGSTWVTKITGKAIADVWGDSKLRFKVEIRNATATKSTDFRILVNSVSIYDADNSPANANFKAKVTDKAVSWRRGDLFEIQLKCDVTGGTAEMKNFQICGKISPVRLD